MAVGVDFGAAAAAGLGLSFAGCLPAFLPASLPAFVAGFFAASLAGALVAPLLAPLAASLAASFEVSLPVPLDDPFAVFLAAGFAVSFAVSLAPSAVVSLDLAQPAQPTDSPAIRHTARPVNRHVARGKEVMAFVAPNQSIGSDPVVQDLAVFD
ncbi:hypothetical protein ACVWW5_003916 [Bradyrhizobium sp. LM3.4]